MFDALGAGDGLDGAFKGAGTLTKEENLGSSLNATTISK